MIVSLGFLLLVVVMSAVIAVIADNVGRKLGKKRLAYRCRAFSIRPKHVAQLGTALTGVFVSLATIGVVALVSSDVRDWIVRGRNAIVESQRLGVRLQEQRQEISDRDARIRNQEQQYEAQAKEVQSGRAALEKQRSELTRLNAEITRLNQEVPRLKGQVTQAQQLVTQANDRLRNQREGLRRARANLDAVRQKLTTNRELLTETDKQKNALITQNTDLLAKNGELERQQRQLAEDIGNLDSARERAVKDLETAQKELDLRQRELASAEMRLQETQSQLRRADLTTMAYRDISRVTRLAPMIYRTEEEIARLPVEEGLNQASAEVALDRLLRMARLAAIERGAKPNAEMPEAGITEHEDTRSGASISIEMIRQDIIRRLEGNRQSMLMVASASINTFRGEPVSLEISIFPNPLIYRKGQRIAEQLIDARKDETEIFRQVSTFLSEKLKEQARKDRLIPRNGTDEAFGSVSSEDILKLVANLRQSERVVRLVASAESDTRAGDPLRVTFQIRL